MRSILGEHKLLLLSFMCRILSSCNSEPPKINFGKDLCDFCKMTVMDEKFGAVLVNKKGKALKFDSGECMLSYLKSDKNFTPQQYLIINYENPGELLNAEKAFYIHGGNVNSPMGGSLAAFKTLDAAEKFQQELKGDLILWNEARQISF
jgi:copper chaperone NosL